MSGRSLNKVMLIGNLTRDPEMRYTPTGSAVTTFSIATNRSWKTDAGEMRDEVEYHRLVSWNKLAEICSQLLTKGKRVYVEGRIQTRSFTGQDGQERTVTEVVIEDMIVLDGGKREISPNEEGNSVSASKVDNKSEKSVDSASDGVVENVNASDIPF